LRLGGLSRAHRIAVPEWSSHCVLSAVGWRATPIGIRESLRYAIPVDAVLVYEQWGWPFVPEAYEEIESHFKGCFLLWDQVDSSHFLQPRAPGFVAPTARVVSLSKLLGYPGGGLLTMNNEYVHPPKEAVSGLTQALLDLPADCQTSFEFKEAFKNGAEILHPHADLLVRENDIPSAIEMERLDRCRNAEALLQSPLVSSWPRWMCAAVARGLAPGIAPLMRGETVERMTACRDRVEMELGIRGEIYNFDWNGNPMRSAYEPCLAVPLHGQVQSIEELISRVLRAMA